MTGAAPLRVLLTGGAGYVGSHVLVELLGAGHEVFVFDSLATAPAETLDRARALARRDFGFQRGDVRDAAALAEAVAAARPDAAIHCAGLKSPSESLREPELYAEVNVAGTRRLMAALAASPCRRMVFSSSAAVYGPPATLPIPEDHPLEPGTPYGASKRGAERLIAEAAAADPRWSAALLRYFNPAGAHDSGALGESPGADAVNLMPNLLAVASGARSALVVHGMDWDTPDGTGVRDYLHVMDLARAHLAALDWTGRTQGAEAFNLGTGRGVSVRELAAAMAAASGQPVPLLAASRRPGDVASAYADPSRAARALGWRAERGIDAICASAWTWHRRHVGEILRTPASRDRETASPDAPIAGK